MDFGRAFTFVIEDPDWLKKILLNGLILLIPVVGGIYLMGWMLEVGRRVANYEEPVRLPDIDFGRFLGLGFKALIVGFVYSLPAIILALPIVIIPAIFGALDLDPDVLGTITALISFLCSCVIVLYSLLEVVLLPAALMRTAMQDNVGAGLKIGEVFALVKNAIGPYLIVVLGTLAASFVASLVGGILCGIGVLFTMVYAYAVMGHFYGQAYRVATRKA